MSAPDPDGAASIGNRLEDLAPGVIVSGLLPEAVTTVSVDWHGPDAVTLVYRDGSGDVGQQLLFRGDEQNMLIGGATTRRFSFDADGELFRLASEARRIRLAHLFDPMLALDASDLQPLPHQITAVYKEMLPRHPLRFLLADDPGAGKTIMAGLYIKELMLRGDLQRCLIVAPGSLVEQWQDELSDKFGLAFTILTREMTAASQGGDPFPEHPLLIARLDGLSRNETLQASLADSEWDLVVVDEAHRMSAHFFGGELQETKRYKLGRLLGRVTRHLLLMTATPHAGKDEDFQLFLALLDPDRFEGKPRGGGKVDASDLMRRMVKEKLLTFEGRPLFPERRAYTVPYQLSPDESELYEQVTHYVAEEMNRAERLGGGRGNTVGFALTVLQRRLASSPEAIYQSLVRRGGRLRRRLEEEQGRARGEFPSSTIPIALGDEDDLDDLAADEREELEEELADSASAARTAAELAHEITEVDRLERLAKGVRDRGLDVKWQQLSSLLADDDTIRDEAGLPRKLIIFTEHRDTLTYLVDRLGTLIGRPEAIVAIHGGVDRRTRRHLQELFTQDPDCRILVATDAAGEGINLQRAHLLINYDLPWNPNKIEQRFGRVHRIGQTETCHMWNLVADETREGQVYLRLLDKIEEQRQAYGGQIFDVLGRLFESTPLRALLVEAIKDGDRPEVRERLTKIIDASVTDGLADLIEQEALDATVLAAADVQRLRLEMEERAARRLQPHYLRSFFLEAFGQLGGRVASREAGRYEVPHVPASLRQADTGSARPTPLQRYTRVTFERPLVHLPGRPEADLIAPGHPLLDVTVDAVLSRYGSLLERGTVLVDEGDPRTEPRLLLYLESAIRDGRGQTASRRFEFVELAEGGAAHDAGHAPYLDYRPASIGEREALSDLLASAWLADGVEDRAKSWAIAHLVPQHLGEVRARTLSRLDRTRAAVRRRLLTEIDYWDGRANELAEQEAAGRQPRINPARARQRAEDLHARLVRREAELDRERTLQPLPPVVVGAALIVPVGLLAHLAGQRESHVPRDTAEVDQRAVAAVLTAERALGRSPEEMPHNNPGYDIRSRTPDGHWLFIEVKGRIAGSREITVTRTEMLTGRNSPDHQILAIVRVSPDGPRGDVIRYVRRAFVDYEPAFAETRRTFNEGALWDQGEGPS